MFLFRYKRDNKRVYYVIIAEGEVSSHENFAENVGAVVRRCPIKKVFLKILDNSLENTSVGASFLTYKFFTKRDSRAGGFL